MTIYCALLRGINVGGRNMISMKALKESCERLGFSNVVTYINSGNVVFRSRARNARKLEATIEKMLVAEYGLDCRVVVRSAAEIAGIIKAFPKNWKDDKDCRYNVIFLRHTIDSKDVVDAFHANTAIERVTYVPGALLWSARAAHMSQTSMQKLASRRIFQDMTVRNAATTRKLHEIMQRK